MILCFVTEEAEITLGFFFLWLISGGFLDIFRFWFWFCDSVSLPGTVCVDGVAAVCVCVCSCFCGVSVAMAAGIPDRPRPVSGSDDSLQRSRFLPPLSVFFFCRVSHPEAAAGVSCRPLLCVSPAAISCSLSAILAAFPGEFLVQKLFVLMSQHRPLWSFHSHHSLGSVDRNKICNQDVET